MVSFQIVLPCYNASGSWVAELAEFHHKASHRYNVQYIVVNDGSTQGDPARAIRSLETSAIPVSYVSYSENRGKGFALRAGVNSTTSDFVLYTDIDFPFTVESMLKVMDRLVSSGADVVAGYRDSEYYINKMSGFRRQLSKSFRFFIRRILRMSVSDTQCGLKAFNGKGRQKFLQTKIDRYLFDFEFIYLCARDRQVKVETVQVQLKDNVIFSTMRPKVLMQEAMNLVSVLIRRGK